VGTAHPTSFVADFNLMTKFGAVGGNYSSRAEGALS